MVGAGTAKCRPHRVISGLRSHSTGLSPVCTVPPVSSFSNLAPLDQGVRKVLQYAIGRCVCPLCDDYKGAARDRENNGVRL